MTKECSALLRQRRRVLHDHLLEPERDQGRLERRLHLGGRARGVLNSDLVLDGPGNNDAFGHVVLDFGPRPAWSRSRAGPGGSAASTRDRSLSRARLSRTVRGTGPTASVHPVRGSASEGHRVGRHHGRWLLVCSRKCVCSSRVLGVLGRGRRAGLSLSRYSLSPSCLRKVTRSYIRFSSTICPSSHLATV